MPPSKNSRRPKNQPQSRAYGAPASRSRSTPAAGKSGNQRTRALEKNAPAKSRFRPKGKPQKVFAIIAILSCGVLLALIVMVGFIDGYGQKNRAQKADAIVVLGARVRPDGKAGQGLRMRVLHAVRLYKKGFAPKIIMTGGVGDNPPSEARVSADLAVQHGVPREAILEENKSTSTWENASFASGICKKHGWKSVLIVSDPFHLWRARRNFERNGMKAFVSPVAVEIWKTQPGRRLFWTSREAVLSVRDWFLRRI